MFETITDIPLINRDNWFSWKIKTIADLKEHCNINPDTHCWEWTHGIMGRGYGRMTYEGKQVFVHRVAWILSHIDENGYTKPEDLISVTIGENVDPKKRVLVLHHCDNRICINPEHLFLGNDLINSQDAKEKGRKLKGSKEFCVNGHPRIETNLYTHINKEGVVRVNCRICQKDRAIAFYHLKTHGIVVKRNAKGEWENVT